MRAWSSSSILRGWDHGGNPIGAQECIRNAQLSSLRACGRDSIGAQERIRIAQWRRSFVLQVAEQILEELTGPVESPNSRLFFALHQCPFPAPRWHTVCASPGDSQAQLGAAETVFRTPRARVNLRQKPPPPGGVALRATRTVAVVVKH